MLKSATKPEKPEIASRVRERLEGLHANADEVLNLLADHLRADLADFSGCFDDEGRLDLDQAKQDGVSRLIRKIKTITRKIPRGKGEEPIRETTVEIELYSAQEAAAKLIPVLGLKQKAKANEADLTPEQRQSRIFELVNKAKVA